MRNACGNVRFIPYHFWICACVAPLCVRTIFSPPTQWRRTMSVSPRISNRRRLTLPFGTPFAAVENRSQAIVRWAKIQRQAETFCLWRGQLWRCFSFAIGNSTHWTYRTERSMWMSLLCRAWCDLQIHRTFHVEIPTVYPKWWCLPTTAHWLSPISLSLAA